MIRSLKNTNNLRINLSLGRKIPVVIVICKIMVDMLKNNCYTKSNRKIYEFFTIRQTKKKKL